MYSKLKRTESKCSRFEEKTQTPDTSTNNLINSISFYSLNKTLVL